MSDLKPEDMKVALERERAALPKVGDLCPPPVEVKICAVEFVDSIWRIEGTCTAVDRWRPDKVPEVFARAEVRVSREVVQDQMEHGGIDVLVKELTYAMARDIEFYTKIGLGLGGNLPEGKNDS